jgi:hypothetical protein
VYILENSPPPPQLPAPDQFKFGEKVGKRERDRGNRKLYRKKRKDKKKRRT